MSVGPGNPDQPYDPVPRPSGPDVNPVSPSTSPSEEPMRQPTEIPAADPGYSPASTPDVQPTMPTGPANPTA